MTWTTDELSRLDRADELRIAGRRDGGSLSKPVIIWAVVVDGELYLRSVRGASGGWYRAVQQRHEGHIDSGGVAADVRFVEVPADDSVQEAVDRGYADKYPSSASSVAAITADAARATTMRAVRD